MPNGGPISTATPQFSIIIAVYNDWGPLEQCLRSLEQQTSAPVFEVIVVDDGSDEPAPDSIRHWNAGFPLIVVPQRHAGIAAARNCGLQNSAGSVLVFTDADCRFEPSCLSALATAIVSFPEHNCFQLHLEGDCSNLVGRAEELRLSTLQNQMLQPDHCIRYLNTSGFAIRRAHIDPNAGLFDPLALRAEDTLLLANLILRGDLPFFVSDATVQHVISLSLIECLGKDVRSAWLEGRTYQIIAAKGVRMRMGNMARLKMLLPTWRAAGQNSIGRAAWFVLVARRMLQRIVSLLYECLPSAAKSVDRAE
jgi:glycosyltransferase involved in cell wall biosynthesis